MKEKCCKEKPLCVINIGLQEFCDALQLQGAKVVQLDWRPPVEQSEEINNLLDDLL